MNDSRRCLVSSIKVLTRERAPVITIYDTIRIKYWDNLEYEIVSQSFCLRRLTYEVLYDSLHHPRSITLARVHPSTNEDSFLCQSLRTLRVLVLARDGQVLTFVTCQGPCQRRAMEVVLS